MVFPKGFVKPLWCHTVGYSLYILQLEQSCREKDVEERSSQLNDRENQFFPLTPDKSTLRWDEIHYVSFSIAQLAGTFTVESLNMADSNTSLWGRRALIGSLCVKKKCLNLMNSAAVAGTMAYIVADWLQHQYKVQAQVISQRSWPLCSY